MKIEVGASSSGVAKRERDADGLGEERPRREFGVLGAAETLAGKSVAVVANRFERGAYPEYCPTVPQYSPVSPPSVVPREEQKIG